MDFDDKLISLLIQKRNVDLEIEKLFEENYKGTIRFSSKKFVADLGEYYFYRAAGFLTDLRQSSTSNSACDFVGKLSKEFQELFDINVEDVRIEIKTRHAQIGNNHLFGLKPEKFDLLAFVSLFDDFSCRHIGVIKSHDITVDNQNRIKYSEYYKNGLVVWKTNDWFEL